MNRRNKIALVFLLLVAQIAGGAITPRIAIIKSSSVGPFNEAVDSMIEVLRQRLPEPEILTFDLDGDEQRGSSVIAEVRRAEPQLIITVGSMATAAVVHEPLVTSPIVFSMVLYPRPSGFVDTSRAITGASLDVPLQTQFAYLRRLFPHARRVGVLYHPEETGLIVDEARKVASKSGFELIAEPVQQPTQATAALEALMDKVEVLWSVADSHVFTPQTTSALILATLRHHTPLFGLSVAHVRAGAVAALSCDYADIGRQTAELSVRVINGERAGAIGVSVPRTTGLALNLRSARRLGVDIPEAVQEEAREIIR